MEIKLKNASTNLTDGSLHMASMSGGRKLRAGEVALAKSVFGSLIDYSKVVLHGEKYFSGQGDDMAMTPFGEVFFGKTYSDDFSKSDIYSKKHFIHEMGHVWQYQDNKLVAPRGLVLCCGTGIANGVESLTRGTVVQKAADSIISMIDPYVYLLESSKRLDDYNLESQAEIIADYFCAILNHNPAYKRLNKKNDSRAFLYEKALGDFLERASR